MPVEIDWSKAPPHATHWCPGNAKIEPGWIYNPGGEYYSCYADKGLEHIPAFPEWRKARLVPRPSEPTWDGEGLPPVGTVCEFTSNGGRNWREASVLFLDEQVILLRGYMLFKLADPDIDFRPIRTPEQIAAEERLKAIDEMAEVYRSNFEGHVKDGCQALYDAGYRKQVQP